VGAIAQKLYGDTNDGNTNNGDANKGNVNDGYGAQGQW